MEVIGKHGRLITPNPPCPKCGSFMYFLREKGTVRFRKCRDCDFKGLEKRNFSWEAIKFWFWKKGIKLWQRQKKK
jgi:transposase-like protein